MHKLIIIFPLPFLFCSCDYPILDQQKEAEPKVAIISFFCPDSAFRIRIEPIVEAFNSVSPQLSIKDVKLTNLETGQVAYLEKEEGLKISYTTTQIYPIAGYTYKIEVNSNKQETTIQGIDSISNKSQQFKFIELSTTVKDFSSGIVFECYIERSITLKLLPIENKEPTYIELLVYINDYLENAAGEYTSKSGLYKSKLKSTTSFITSEDYYPSITSMDALLPQSLLFRRPNNKDSLIVNFTYSNATAASMDEIFSTAHDLRIELRNISHSYYNYLTALYKQQNTIKGDIVYGSASPVTVPSNIANGTGVFAGYNTAVFDTFIGKYVHSIKK